MDTFPQDLRETIRVRLEEDKKLLVAQISGLMSQDPFSDPDRAVDNAASDHEASEEYNHDRVTAMIDELKTKLIAIDESLFRIGNGTYGSCLSCKKMINTDRLAILPTAGFCEECERKQTKLRSF